MTVMLRDRLQYLSVCVVVLVACAPSAPVRDARARIDDECALSMSSDDLKRLLVRSAEMPPSAARALEQRLKTGKDDLIVRAQLLEYYDAQIRYPEPGEANRDKVFSHLRWMIHRCPGSAVLWRRCCMRAIGSGGRTAFEEIRALWLAQVEKYAGDPMVLANAGSFIMYDAPDAARELLERARKRAPNDYRVNWALAGVYSFISDDRHLPPAERAHLSERALGAYEVVIASGGPIWVRMDALGDASWIAIQAGLFQRVEQYAKELLKMAEMPANRDFAGRSIHQGHIALGMVALKRGDLAAAKKHLIEAAGKPGSDMFRIFGPNMTLAQELLVLGERDAVIEYLQRCKSPEDKEIDEWIAAIRAGDMPKFGPNLFYW